MNQSFPINICNSEQINQKSMTIRRFQNVNFYLLILSINHKDNENNLIKQVHLELF